VAAHHPASQALTLGFHAAFLGAAGFVLIAIVAAISIGRRAVTGREAQAVKATA